MAGEVFASSILRKPLETTKLPNHRLVLSLEWDLVNHLRRKT